MPKLMVALSVASLTFAGGVVAGPSAAAASSHSARPSSVSLTSSYANVTSSTDRALHVVLTASNNPSTPANDAVTIELARGPRGLGESHSWVFPISSSVLQVKSSGAGTLQMSAADIAPFGTVDLLIKAIGKIASTSCQGHVISKTVKVSLSGVFSFDSKSTGAHAWGTVGSQKSFTFPATNTVTWLLPSPTSQDCISSATPCTAQVFWSAQQGGMNLDGLQAESATMSASRSVTLSKPHSATRSDSAVAPTKPLTVVSDAAGNASLSVRGSGAGATGAATLTSSSPSLPLPTPCGRGRMQNSGFWLADYVNGPSPLTVAEQIYGAVTLANNDNATISDTTVS